MRSIAAFLLLLCAPAAWATAQFADELIFRGRSEPLHTNPLDSAPGAFGFFSKYRGRCTALWRGYVATWEIRGEELYLTRVLVDACSSERREVPLSDLFPGAKGAVKATWYRGRLTVPQGAIVRYVHGGYESRFESYLFIDISAGNVTRLETSR